jgi:adenine phosphoribosyltransferase
MDRLRSLIRDVPDFPEPGIVFRDIMPILREPDALRTVVDGFADRFRSHEISVVAGIESRGFLFGTPLALALNAGFVAVRKLGKLPGETLVREYELEYGTNHLEVQKGSLRAEARVLLIDDVLATGGTARAARQLLQALGAEVVAAGFLLELTELGGRQRLEGLETVALLAY